MFEVISLRCSPSQHVIARDMVINEVRGLSPVRQYSQFWRGGMPQSPQSQHNGACSLHGNQIRTGASFPWSSLWGDSVPATKGVSKIKNNTCTKTFHQGGVLFFSFMGRQTTGIHKHNTYSAEYVICNPSLLPTLANSDVNDSSNITQCSCYSTGY